MFTACFFFLQAWSCSEANMAPCMVQPHTADSDLRLICVDQRDVDGLLTRFMGPEQMDQSILFYR